MTIFMANKFGEKKCKCENCGEELSSEEIKRGDGWCFDCDLPVKGDPYV
jgi:hypothetical protein